MPLLIIYPLSQTALSLSGWKHKPAKQLCLGGELGLMWLQQQTYIEAFL